MDDCRLAVVLHVGRGIQDESSVILEQIRGDGPDLGLLLCGLCDDVCEIGNVVRRAREAVQFLQYDICASVPIKRLGRDILGETYVRDL